MKSKVIRIGEESWKFIREQGRSGQTPAMVVSELFLELCELRVERHRLKSKYEGE